MLEFLRYGVEIIFFLVLLSYYYLLLKKERPLQKDTKIKGMSILIPARNEERFIEACINSVLNASFSGKKEIIMIDDSCTDKTYDIAKKHPIKIIRNKRQLGKAESLNKALSRASYDVVAVVDADSVVCKDAFEKAMPFLESSKIAAVTSTIKVKNRNTFLGMWLHIEQLYNSLMRSFFSKINANINTPGPLSIYRKKDLLSVGGFEKKGYSEDVDIAIKLIRSGKEVKVSESSISETNMPVSVKGFFKQRMRFSRGWIHIFKKHIGFRHKAIDLYSLPLAVFWYVQAVIMSFFIFTQIILGYYEYFYLQGHIFNVEVIKYLLGWFSAWGTIRWAYSIFAGQVAVNLFTGISLFSTLMSYPLYLIAIFRYDKVIRPTHLIPLAFMFPFWSILMIINLFNISELFLKEYRYNIWEKVN